MRICRAVAWEVDAALRPEGKDGPLVRTLASHEAYYRRWASTWEFQALLKARPVAGDLALGARLRTGHRTAGLDGGRAPRTSSPTCGRCAGASSTTSRSRSAAREIKLARGGLRDVEFAVQLLQLVHGRGDESLRIPETLPALDALRDGGYVGRDDARQPDRRVHVPAGDRASPAAAPAASHARAARTSRGQLAWLAKAMGFRPDRRGDARAVWEAEWDLHAREVRRLHEKLFYRPLLEAVARVPSADLRLTTARGRPTGWRRSGSPTRGARCARSRR